MRCRLTYAYAEAIGRASDTGFIQLGLTGSEYLGHRRVQITQNIMNKLSCFFVVITLATSAGIAQARDLCPDKALKVRDAGTIQSFEKLNKAALAKYPDEKIKDTELKQKQGRYVYQVELHDAQREQWNVALDATNGQVLKKHRDD